MDEIDFDTLAIDDGAETEGVEPPEAPEATTTPAPEVGDAPEPEDDDSGEGPEDKDAAAEPKPKKEDRPKSRKVKYTRRGEERELDLDELPPEELAKLLDDNSEHDVRVSGEERRVKLADLYKDYELREASHGRMRDATEKIKAFEQTKERLKSDHDYLNEWLKSEVGIENPTEILAVEQQRQEYLNSLMDPNSQNYDPQRYTLITRALERERATREIQQQQQKAEQERVQKQKQAQMAEFRKRLPKALDGVGLQQTDAVNSILRLTAGQLQAAGQELTPENLAYETKRTLVEALRSQVPTDPAQLKEFLGEDRLKALRKMDAEAVRKGEAVKKSNGGGTPKKATPAANRKTAEEILKESGWAE